MTRSIPSTVCPANPSSGALTVVNHLRAIWDILLQLVYQDSTPSMVMMIVMMMMTMVMVMLMLTLTRDVSPQFENKSTNLSINQSTHYYLILLFFICDKKFLHKVLFSIKSLYWNLSQINSNWWTTSVYNLPNGIWYAIKSLPWNHNDLTFQIGHGQGQGQGDQSDQGIHGSQGGRGGQGHGQGLEWLFVSKF